jgi:dephospho-CoA kinase
MIKIGVTGGIGSGKSMICKIFEQQGYPVYYTDDQAKFLISTNKNLQNEIIALLGGESFVEGVYNRQFVAEKVFNDQTLLQQLNDLVHPHVELDFEQFITNTTAKLIFKESALLFDDDSYKKLDEVIYVSAPKSLRIERIKTRDSFRTEEEISNIIDKQFPESKAVLLADYIVVNDEVESVIEQLDEIKEIILL